MNTEMKLDLYLYLYIFFLSDYFGAAAVVGVFRLSRRRYIGRGKGERMYRLQKLIERNRETIIIELLGLLVD